MPPSIYGFIPCTYAGASVAALMPGAAGGDRDALDICVLSVDRLVHYFSTYKRHRSEAHEVSVGEPYGRAHAEAVITAAMADYVREFPASADVP